MNADIPFNRPTLVANEIRYLREAIERQQLSGDGHFTKLCSTEIERLSHRKSFRKKTTLDRTRHLECC